MCKLQKDKALTRFPYEAQRINTISSAAKDAHVTHQGVVTRKRARHNVPAHDDVADEAVREAQQGEHTLSLTTAG
jgi:hypothetical protein